MKKSQIDIVIQKSEAPRLYHILASELWGGGRCWSKMNLPIFLLDRADWVGGWFRWVGWFGWVVWKKALILRCSRNYIQVSPLCLSHHFTLHLQKSCTLAFLLSFSITADQLSVVSCELLDTTRQ